MAKKKLKTETTITLNFSEEDMKWLGEKFDIYTEEDLTDAVWEMISTYMELD